MTEEEGSVTSYGYDAMHRLTSEARTTTNAYSYSYGLDGAGNRTSKTVSGTATCYTNDGDDRVTAGGSGSYSYNANGETTSKTVGGTTYNFAYTYDGLIDYYNVGGSNTVSFGYDALGRRVFRSTSSATTGFYYNGAKVLCELIPISGSRYQLQSSGMVLPQKAHLKKIFKTTFHNRSGFPNPKRV